MTDDLEQYSLDRPVKQRSQNGTAPLTAMQLWGWNYYCRQGMFRGGRMCAASLRITGTLNTDILGRCIDALVQRHQALRTRIAMVGMVPQQLIDPPGERLLQTVDLSDVAPATIESRLKRQAQLFVRKKIDLSIGPLFEARLWKLSNRNHVLILMLDHIVSDGASYAILNRELWDLYERGLNDRPIALEELPVQFADYAVWQQSTRGDWISRHGSYWSKRLEEPRQIQIPHDCLQQRAQDAAAKMLVVPLGAELAGELRKFAQRQGTLLSLVVLSVYVLVVSRWCKQEDLILQFISHGRHSKRELVGVVGFFANHLHLRIQIAAADTPVDILRKTRVELQSAMEHQDFDRVPLLYPQCSTKITFNWQSSPARSARALADMAILEYSAGINDRHFPFYNVDEPVEFAPAFFDKGSDIDVLINYRADLLSSMTVRRFLDNLKAVAEGFVSHPTARVADMPGFRDCF